MCCKELREMLGGKNDCYSVSTVASENGKEFRLNLKNSNTACKVKVDGCLISDQTVTKCDYLFKICPLNKYFLVELKGTDVDHAVGQILSTFAFVNNKIKEKAKKEKQAGKKVEAALEFTGYIISSAIPRNAEQKFRNLREKALKNNGLNIAKHSSKCELSI